jgi:hypothetical protein
MPNARSQSNAFQLVDYTDELLLIPNQWGLINELGLFSAEPVSKHSVEFDETEGTLSLLKDMPRGERAQYNKEDYSKLHSVPVPHYNYDDAIKPEDVQGRRRTGTVNEDMRIADARAKKMERMRRNWAATVEYARSQALQGNVYAPNGTVTLNWYTEMNQSQQAVDFDLDTTTTDLIAKNEAVIAHIQDNILSGEIVTEIVGICSSEFFSDYVSHASVVEAYKYYSSQVEPLRNRLGSGRFRQFEHGGLRLIEYRGSFAGSRIIPANEAYFVPMGTSDMFKTYYSPAHKFDLVNTLGEEQYLFEYDNGKGTEITLETESNFLNAVRRPQAVVKGNRDS